MMSFCREEGARKDKYRMKVGKKHKGWVTDVLCPRNTQDEGNSVTVEKRKQNAKPCGTG